MSDIEMLNPTHQPIQAAVEYSPMPDDCYGPVAEQAVEIADGMGGERMAEEADVMAGGMSWAMNKLRNTRPARWAAGVLSSAAILAPGVASASHTGGKLERECASEILTEPTIETAFMQNAGKPNQLVFAKFAFDGVKKECDSRFKG